MNQMRSRWILAVIVALAIGVAAGRLFAGIPQETVEDRNRTSALSGIEKLHELDQRVTILNSAKALQQEWTNDAVRLEADSPPDIGKAAIYASDMEAFAQAPGSAIVSYEPTIRNVQVAGDWAFEWGVFTAGYRPGANRVIETVRGKVLRVLHQQPNGEWKFARVMVAIDSKCGNSL